MRRHRCSFSLRRFFRWLTSDNFGERTLMIRRTSLLSTALVSVLRSEEHTSELQSLMRISYAVFCLKKKTKRHNEYIITTQKRTAPYDMNTKSKTRNVQT